MVTRERGKVEMLSGFRECCLVFKGGACQTAVNGIARRVVDTSTEDIQMYIYTEYDVQQIEICF